MTEHQPQVSSWLAFSSGRLEIRSGKVDIGQRISTALIEIVHEELTVPRHQIQIAPVRTGFSPNEGMTAGSTSVEQGGSALRRAAVTLKRRVIDRAAERTGSSPEEWSLEGGVLHGPGQNRPIAFLEAAEGLDLGFAVDPDLPPPVPRARPPAPPMHGMQDIASGAYQFLQDIELPGMLHARVIRPPHARARLLAIRKPVIEDLADRGIATVQDGSFLAVAGPHEWQVMNAAVRLAAACSWDASKGFPEDDVDSMLHPAAAERLLVKDGVPLPGEEIPPRGSEPDHEARYLRPFTMHASLAPSAALALRNGDGMSITAHSQGIHQLRDCIAECLGLETDSVEVTYAPGSGCYGHNGADDAALEAAVIASALPGAPILLKWSREDEHCWEPYGPPQAVEMAAWLGTDGKIEKMSIEAIGGTHLGRPRPNLGPAGQARFISNRFREPPAIPAAPVANRNWQGGVHRNLDPCYAIPDLRLVKNLVADLPHRTSALRCLGASVNTFAIESFMDELAAATGQAPLSFRRRHLEDWRAIELIDRLEEAMLKAGSRDSAGSGVAYGQYKNQMARVAVGVFLSVSDDARIQLERAIIVADAGRIVDLHGLEAQMEGGFLQAASWALHEEVSWDRDGITSRDWDSYPVLRFDNVPVISTIAVDRPEREPSGAGEAACGPALAAIANAVFDATGIRMRRLPMTADAIRRSALVT